MDEEKQEKEGFDWGDLFGHGCQISDFDLEFIDDDFGIYGQGQD